MLKTVQASDSDNTGDVRQTGYYKNISSNTVFSVSTNYCVYNRPNNNN